MTSPRRYTEDRQRSREILRNAVPLMSAHEAALNPVAFSVWYEFCAGRNIPLHEAMQKLLVERILDDETTAQLFCEFIADPEIRAARLLGKGFATIMTEMLESAREVGTRTEKFEQALQRFDAALQGEETPDEALLTEMISQTSQVRGAMHDLREQLDRTQKEAEVLRHDIEERRAAAEVAESKVHDLQSVVQTVQAEAARDPLTGLANRRILEQEMTKCLGITDERAVLAFCDIDHFKAVNDSHGHAFGDDVLRKIANVIASFASGPGDTAARYGGEEFVILMRHCSLQDGYRMAETIRRCVERASIMRRRATKGVARVTISIGVAARKGQGDTMATWLARSDKALYAAKQSGRNQVRLAEPE